jgi:GNAT superfamily N-acetyltransferase
MWEAIGRGTPDQLDDHDRRYRAWLRSETRAGRFVAFVACEASGRSLGSGAIWLMPSQPRPDPHPRKVVPYILSMYTDPGARGRGVASRIVRELVRWARAEGYGRVLLHASKMGRHVYERLGFRATNEMRRNLRGAGRGRRAVRR